VSRFGSRSRTRRRLALLAATAGFAALLGGVVAWTGVLQRAEGASLDARFALLGAQRPGPVSVVGIDGATLNDPKLPRWPWPRSLQGRLIRAVRELRPRLIVYDVEVIQPTTQRQDLSLYAAVSASRPVVMVSSRVGPGGATPIFGGNRNLTAAGGLPAYPQFPVAPGGEVRRLSAGFNGLPSVALVAARAVGHRQRLAGDAEPLIDFPGGAGTVPEISAVDVLDHRPDARRLRGRIVVIGTTDPNLLDVHATAAAGGSLLSGPELEADAISTALAGFPLRPAPGWLGTLLVLVSALVAPALAAWRTATTAVAGAFTWLCAGAGIAALAFAGGTVLPLFAPLTATVVSGAGVVLVDLLTVRRERAALIATFERYVPRDHVGRVVAAVESGAGLPEQLEATVMFCDLRGYTGFAEGRAPEELLAALNRYLGDVSDAVMDHGGSVVTFLGDGVMSVFGAPLPTEHHADQAVAAARAVVQAVGAGRVGVGIATGAVISGTVGSGRRLEYAAIGDTTNVAARVQTLTREVGRPILLTSATRDKLTDGDDLDCLGEFKLRGRGAGLTLFAPRDAVSRT
jgi:adenylate cyclase